MQPTLGERAWSKRRVDQAALAIIGLGGVIRLAMGLRYGRHFFDIESYRVTAQAFKHYHLHAYQVLRHSGGRWPYPPGFVPWALLADSLAGGGQYFAFLIKLPFFAAELALAWFCYWKLGQWGTSPTRRLLAVAVIALGPLLILDSGYRGQLDSLAVLPAVVAVVLWREHPDGVARACVAGLLVGLAGSLKTVPFVMLLALLPSAKSWRDRLALIVSAAAIPFVLLLPFLATGARAVVSDLSYRGLPGVGGISLMVQPSLANYWVHYKLVTLSGASKFVAKHSFWFIAPPVLLAGATLLWRRTEALTAALAIWLVVYVFSPNLAPIYLVWAVPFLVLADYIEEAAVVVVVAFAPAALQLLHHRGSAGSAAVYLVSSIVVWTGLVAALVFRPSPLRRWASVR